MLNRSNISANEIDQVRGPAEALVATQEPDAGNALEALPPAPEASRPPPHPRHDDEAPGWAEQGAQLFGVRSWRVTKAFDCPLR